MVGGDSKIVVPRDRESEESPCKRWAGVREWGMKENENNAVGLASGPAAPAVSGKIVVTVGAREYRAYPGAKTPGCSHHVCEEAAEIGWTGATEPRPDLKGGRYNAPIFPPLPVPVRDRTRPPGLAVGGIGGSPPQPRDPTAGESADDR